MSLCPLTVHVYIMMFYGVLAKDMLNYTCYLDITIHNPHTLTRAINNTYPNDIITDKRSVKFVC